MRSQYEIKERISFEKHCAQEAERIEENCDRPKITSTAHYQRAAILEWVLGGDSKIENREKWNNKIMSLFLKHPHLFANGKFQVRIPDKNMKIGYRERELTPHIVQVSRDGILQPSLKYCTLIARPISDMTAEEIKGFPSYTETEPIFRDQIEGLLENDVLTFDDRMHLLSIGVYPGKQNDKNVKFIQKPQFKN